MKLYPYFKETLKKGQIIRRVKDTLIHKLWVYPCTRIGDINPNGRKPGIPIFKGVICPPLNNSKDSPPDRKYIDKLIKTNKLNENLVTFHGYAKSIPQKDYLNPEITKTEMGKFVELEISQDNEEYVRIDTDKTKINCYENKYMQNYETG